MEQNSIARVGKTPNVRAWLRRLPKGEYLERLLDFRPDESSATRFDRLAQCLDDCGLGRPEVVALFAKLPEEERASLARERVFAIEQTSSPSPVAKMMTPRGFAFTERMLDTTAPLRTAAAASIARS